MDHEEESLAIEVYRMRIGWTGIGTGHEVLRGQSYNIMHRLGKVLGVIGACFSWSAGLEENPI